MKLVQQDREETPSSGGSSDSNGAVRRLSVLMPVYNERWTLSEIVARVLTSPVPLEIELIIVDDCSTDGSWELIRELAAGDARIVAVRHEQNSGKGTALRTAIGRISGEVAVVQDADLEYDPHEFRTLLSPILSGKADAVFGSRYAGSTRRVSPFWHTTINKGLTLLSNVVNNLCLTDMETCYKMVRSDILKRLQLKSRSFTFEPELTCRLAQWGARIYEVPIGYNSRTYLDGKKIRPRDGILALGEIFRARFLDTRFTVDGDFYRLSALARATRYHRWLAEQIEPYLGARVLEAGAGLGSLSGLLVHRERLVLVDEKPLCIPVLQQRFGGRGNVRIDSGQLVAQDFERWHDEQLDTVVCSRMHQQQAIDEPALQGMFNLISPGGHCILLLPASRNFDAARDQPPRFELDRIGEEMMEAGFDIVLSRRFDTLGRLVGGQLSPRQVALADRFWPLTRLADLLLPIGGQSLLIVGRKPDQKAKSIAA